MKKTDSSRTIRLFFFQIEHSYGFSCMTFQWDECVETIYTSCQVSNAAEQSRLWKVVYDYAHIYQNSNLVKGVPGDHQNC